MPRCAGIAWCRPPNLRRLAILETRAKFAAALGGVLKRHRLDRGINVTRFAEMLECDRPHVHKIERGGHEVNLGTLVRFAVVLNVPASELLAEAERWTPAD